MENNRINPARKNFFNYEFDGVTITFIKIGKKMNGSSRFTFEVIGDPELTQKLNKSVKATKVQFKGIPFAAEALFQIIRQGEFKELIPHNEWVEMKEKFHEYFDKYPKFEITDISTVIPKFHATIIHPALQVEFYGIGRTKTEAKAKALKKLLDA